MTESVVWVSTLVPSVTITVSPPLGLSWSQLVEMEKEEADAAIGADTGDPEVEAPIRVYGSSVVVVVVVGLYTLANSVAPARRIPLIHRGLPCGRVPSSRVMKTASASVRGYARTPCMSSASDPGKFIGS